MPSRRSLKLQKAKIGWLADDETRVIKTPQAVANAGKDVIERIKKCFARANHENANEAEARAAVKMASRIMEQHKIEQSDLMQAEDQSQRERRGGLSTVNIWPAENSQSAHNQGWVTILVGAMQRFFDCRSYSTDYEEEITWTFYGIAEHTVSAAIAFEATHNQIQEWAGNFKGVSTRNSYSIGIARGLSTLAEEEKEATEESVRRYEARALAARIREEDIKQQVDLHKLSHPSPTISPEPETGNEMDIDEADSEHETGASYGGSPLLNFFNNPGYVSDDQVQADFNGANDTKLGPVETSGDFDAELQKFIVPDSTAYIQDEYARMNDDDIMSSTEIDEELTPGDTIEDTAEWKSMRQLSTYREMSKDIEDSVLQAHKIKLKKGRKVKQSVKDRDAYQKGEKDSKKIEVRAGRIEHDKN